MTKPMSETGTMRAAVVPREPEDLLREASVRAAMQLRLDLDPAVQIAPPGKLRTAQLAVDGFPECLRIEE